MPQYAHLLHPTRLIRPPRQLFEFRPPRPWLSGSTPPEIVDLATYVEVHQRADDRIKSYLEVPRAHHRETASYDAIFELRRESAHALYANNNDSRIAFVEIALKHILDHPHIKLGPCCYVTFTPARFAFRMEDHGVVGRRQRSKARQESEAGKFDLLKLQNMAREALRGVPFVGIAEVALYRHWSASGWAPYDTASWHLHLLTWGGTADDIRPLLMPLRKRHVSLLEDVSAVHVEDVVEGALERKICYSLKAPQKLYRVEYWRDPGNETADPLTSPGSWRTNKDWLRTGSRVRLLDVLADRTLDQLLFGNYEGTDLVRAIRREALLSFNAWESKQRWYRC